MKALGKLVQASCVDVPTESGTGKQDNGTGKLIDNGTGYFYCFTEAGKMLRM